MVKSGKSTNEEENVSQLGPKGFGKNQGRGEATEPLSQRPRDSLVGKEIRQKWESREMKQTFGIRQRIRHAESVSEIDELLRELDGYDHPSAQTIAACRTAARKRRKELQNDT